jgi:predicted nucleotidyltransferase
VCVAAESYRSAKESTATLMLTYPEQLRAMHESGADYVLMGLGAAAAYGSTLASNDFDFFIRPDPVHLDRAREAFRRLGMTESLPTVASFNIIASEATVTLVDPLGGPFIDLMTHISGPTFDEVWRKHQVRDLGEIRVRVASLEHIIASKRAANREKDRYALKRLKEDLEREIRENRAKSHVRKKKKKKKK